MSSKKTTPPLRGTPPGEGNATTPRLRRTPPEEGNEPCPPSNAACHSPPLEGWQAKPDGVVPRLRFPEFRGADDWKAELLGNICKPQQWATISSSDLAEEGYPVYGANGFIGYYTHFNHEFETVAVTCRGSTCGEISLIPPKSYITGNSMCLDEINHAENSYNFVYQFLKQRGFKDIISGSAQPQIVGNAIKKLKIVLPKRGEQQKIADCLSSLDELITAEAYALAALKTHKKGLMQQLFPREGETVPHLRFPEFREAGEWVEKSLGEIGEIVTGKTPSTSDDSLWNGDIQFVTPTDISEEKYQWKTQRSVAGNARTKALPLYSTMFTCIASIGKVALSVKPCITNQQINTLIPNKGYDNEFVYYSLLNIVPLIKSTQANSTLPIINKTEFSKFVVPVPKVHNEQQQIADCLSSIDDLITAQSQKIDALKTHKKGLMQQLFPVLDEVQG